MMPNTNTTVFALIASDIAAALRAHLLRKHRNMFRHTQESLITLQLKALETCTQSGYFLILPGIALIFYPFL
jgi:hypothetical protein